MNGGAAVETAHPGVRPEEDGLFDGVPPSGFIRARMCDASPAALGAFVTDNHAFTWRMVRRLGVPESSVDDAVQQIFMIVVQRLGSVVAGKDRSFLFSTIL